MLCVGHVLFAQLKLPKVFADNMVLQRDKPIKIWGWAKKGEAVSVSFNQQTAKAMPDSQGNWQLTLNSMTHGGPFEMIINQESEKMVLHNILIGDVWICSGQSNMEMPIEGWGGDSIKNATSEIKAASFPQIRLFTVERALSYSPVKDVNGNWQECSPRSVSSFSAVAYFFGRKLNQDLNIPIGLINTSWGGTNIQAWTSWDEMSKLDDYRNVKINEILQQQKKWKENSDRYNAALMNDIGMSEKWFAENTNVSSWKKVVMPQQYERFESPQADGIVWFRKDFNLTAEQVASAATVNLGAIDDSDETYINGKLIGKMNNWSANRSYTIESGLLKKGTNNITVKVLDTGGGGGFSGQAKDMFLKIGSDQISLAGDWLYKASVLTTQFNVRNTGPNAFPSQLYNAMIAPLTNFQIKGAIWYQGEANTSEAYAYRNLFPGMITNWRSKWNDNFPFLWVQLANFMQPVVQPSESEWAELREAQHMTLKLPRTGESVAIDVGEANDIHPKNKQDVGKRLALAALKVAYEKDGIYSGPVFQSMEVKENKIILNFAHQGSGLVSTGDKYGYLKGFAIAGADQHFVWAKAYIEGDKVVVFSNEVKQPMAVRYAWGDNPDDANLYNKEGLPASPFRTDTWKGLTMKK
jgi:sialate O-acetylesterase